MDGGGGLIVDDKVDGDGGAVDGVVDIVREVSSSVCVE